MGRVVDQNIQRAESLLGFLKQPDYIRFFRYSPRTAMALPPLSVMAFTTLSAPSLLEA